MDQQQTDDYYKNNGAARVVALVIVCIGSFLAPLALSSVNVAAPAIAKALKADAIYVSWIPTSLLLANVITLLPIGRLADIWGRKRMYLSGSILFALSCLVCSFAEKIEWLLLFRVFQGVALSMTFSCAMAIVTSIYRSGQRGAVLGTVAAFVYFGLTCGPLIGGWLTEYFGWRAVFMFPIPLLLLSIALLLWKLKGEWRGPPRSAFGLAWQLAFCDGGCGVVFRYFPFAFVERGVDIVYCLFGARRFCSSTKPGTIPTGTNKRYVGK